MKRAACIQVEANRESELRTIKPLEIVLKPRLNHWRGRAELQLVLEDFRCGE